MRIIAIKKIILTIYFCRCVVSSLTEEGPSDLADELIKGEALQTDENTPSDDEEINWENWLPDPVDADPSKLYF